MPISLRASRTGKEAEDCVRMTCRSFPLEEEAGFGPKQRGALTRSSGNGPPGSYPCGSNIEFTHLPLAQIPSRDPSPIRLRVPDSGKRLPCHPDLAPRLFTPKHSSGAPIMLSLLEVGENQSKSVYSFNHINILAPSALASACLMS